MRRCKNRGVKFGGYNVCAVRVRGSLSENMIHGKAESITG